MIDLARFSPVAAPEPPPDTWLEFSRKVRLPDGPFAGQYWDPDSEPAQAAFVEALDSGVYRSFVVAMCSQTGKSLQAIQVPSLKFITQERIAAAYILPSLEVLDRNWTEKIKPGIEGCGFKSWLPKTGPGSKGGRPKAIRFMDPKTQAAAGSLVFMAAGSGNTKETSLASSTVGAVLIDEVDDFTDVNHVKLGIARGASFGDMCYVFLACTVNKSENSIILWFYVHSTHGRLHYACPHCGEYQKLSRHNIKYHGKTESEVMESARYACDHCGALWTEPERREALRTWRYVMDGQTVGIDGVVIGEAPKVRSWGLLAGQLDFHIGLGLPELAREHWEAQKAIDEKDDHSAMRFYVQKRHSEQYDGDKDHEDTGPEMSTRYLANKFARHGFATFSTSKDELGSRYYADEIPEQVERSVLAVDVQGNRVYWSLVGYDSEKRTWDLAWGYEFGDETQSAFGPGGLSATLLRVDKYAESFGVMISDKVVDTGYDTKELVKFLRKHRDWFGIRGVPSIPKKLAKKHGGLIAKDRKWKPGLGRFDVVTNDAMKKVHDAYKVEVGLPGAACLPKGLKASDAYLRHLCSWLFIQKGNTPGLRWVQQQARNDHFDTRSYAISVIGYRLEMEEDERAAEEENEQDESQENVEVSPVGDDWGADVW